MEELDEWGVYSEVGRLRSVLVHRPGQEHRWTLPRNKEALLFDDIIDIEEAREEHSLFTEKLSGSDARKVLFVTDLLQDICASEGNAREDILREIIGGNFDMKNVRPHHVICGYPDDFPSKGNGNGSANGIEFDPAPNCYFTRDPAFAVPGAVVISSPKKKPRRREARLMRSLFQHHRMLRTKKVYSGILEAAESILEAAENSSEDPPAPYIEGGDVQVVDPRTVLIGISSRTNEWGADLLTEYLFRETSVEKVLKIKFLNMRDFMHLDTVMTFIDRERILTLPYLWDDHKLYDDLFKRIDEQRERAGEDFEREEIDFRSSLEVVLKNKGGAALPSKTYDNVIEGLHDQEVINKKLTVYVAGKIGKFSSPADHVIAALREQWNDAANVLALKPGQVVCYHRNDRTQRALEEAGLEVVSFRGGELVRGRGGARCMTMPLYRERA